MHPQLLPVVAPEVLQLPRQVLVYHHLHITLKQVIHAAGQVRARKSCTLTVWGEKKPMSSMSIVGPLHDIQASCSKGCPHTRGPMIT